MGIERVDSSSRQDLREWYDVVEAARSVDHPDLPCDPFEELLAEASAERRSRRQEWWLLREGSRPVAAAALELPLLDNTDNVAVQLVVHPDHRRRGLGRTLAEHVFDRARSVGRRRIIAEVGEPLLGGETAPGPAFAKSLGATRALDDIVRVLDLDTVDGEELARLGATARERAGGYDLVQWVGAVPDDVIADLAVLLGRMSIDAPLGDLEWAPEHWDAERVREQDERTAARRRQRLVTAARHRESGRLVAFSDLGVSTIRPEAAYQWDTIVLADHRGHRLGLLAKLANLALLRREVPAAQRIITWNAESNTHMVAINDALGFRPVERSVEWQLDI